MLVCRCATCVMLCVCVCVWVYRCVCLCATIFFCRIHSNFGITFFALRFNLSFFILSLACAKEKVTIRRACYVLMCLLSLGMKDQLWWYPRKWHKQDKQNVEMIRKWKWNWKDSTRTPAHNDEEDDEKWLCLHSKSELFLALYYIVCVCVRVRVCVGCCVHDSVGQMKLYWRVSEMENERPTGTQRREKRKWARTQGGGCVCDSGYSALRTLHSIDSIFSNAFAAAVAVAAKGKHRIMCSADLCSAPF